MRHLPQRVYAGIRTPGTMDAYDLSGQPLHRLLQALLDGRAVVLPLPADKFAAVILDGQFPPVHDAASTHPTATLKPRRKAAPSTGALPGRCTRISRTAPSAQATVRLPSSRVPGLASGAACAGSAASTLIRSLPRSNQTPGHGLSARTCRSMKSAGWLQSSLPSSRLSLVAYVTPSLGCGSAVSRPSTRPSSACTISPAPNFASASCRLPAVASAVIGTLSFSSMAPVSRPASICMMVTPVSVSPA